MTGTVARVRPSADQRIKAALWFADKGFGVFAVWSTTDAGVCRCPSGAACTSPGKHPWELNGFKDATTDPSRIRTLLAAASQPNYGLVPPEGVFALDVDADDDGIARLGRLEAMYGPLPATLRTQTANGQHVFLRWPGDLPRPLKKMFGYVTRWGSGKQAGYVIGPRSVHASGAEYQPAAGGSLEIAELPEAWARAVVEGEAEPVIAGPKALPSVGSRHDWLRDRARYYRGVIDDPAVLRVTLLAENARLAEPKTDAEVDRAIGNVFENFPPDPPSEVEERTARKLGDDDLDLLGAPTSGMFPDPPAPEAFDGLVGELVEDLAGGTDASMVGLLGATIAFAGALIPGSAYFHRDQTSSPFIALVGESSIGRKGTAMIRVMDAMSNALEKTTVHRVVMDGINSGEGLVTSLYYRREHFGAEPTVGLVFEEEYASLLASRGREGSTLDPKMRQAFDGSPLSNRKAGETKTVMPNYWLPALIGITPVELRHRLEPGALQTGSANRWLYLPVIRRDVTPSNAAPAYSPENRTAVADAHRAAQRIPPLLTVDPAVTRTLHEYADFLPQASHGLGRDLTRRLGIIAFRVALVHALVERAESVTTAHLHRALALTEYARRGIDWVFGDTIGNPDANLLFRHLAATGRLSRRAITQNIVRDPIRRQDAIDELVRIGRGQVVTVQTGGRPRSELLLGPAGGAFVHFVQGLTTPRGETSETLHGMHESAYDVAQKVHESRTEVHVSPGSLAEWISPCHFYADHQSAHRQTPAGWVCDICKEGTAAPPPLITVGENGPRNASTDANGLRYYTWQGKRYPSVTTIRRLAGIPHGLHQWALNQVINRVLDEAPSIAGRLGSGDPADVAMTRQYLRTAATEERDKAAQRGTAVHEAAAARRSLTEVGPDIAPHLRQYLDWLEKSRVEVVASEFQVWNPTVGYAGTCDLLGRFPDGSTWVIDLKTGKGVYGEHALQLMAYLMAEFVGSDDVVDEALSRELGLAKGIAVLHLGSDSWEFHSLRADPDTWAAYRGLLTFGVWMAGHGTIGDVSLGSRKGAA